MNVSLARHSNCLQARQRIAHCRFIRETFTSHLYLNLLALTAITYLTIRDCSSVRYHISEPCIVVQRFITHHFCNTTSAHSRNRIGSILQHQFICSINTHLMATNYGFVKCKSCVRVLATMSVTVHHRMNSKIYRFFSAYRPNNRGVQYHY